MWRNCHPEPHGFGGVRDLLFARSRRCRNESPPTVCSGRSLDRSTPNRQPEPKPNATRGTLLQLYPAGCVYLRSHGLRNLARTAGRNPFPALQFRCARKLEEHSHQGPLFRPTERDRRPLRGLPRNCQRRIDRRAFLSIQEYSSGTGRLPRFARRLPQPGIRRVEHPAPSRRRSRFPPARQRRLTHSPWPERNPPKICSS
jgi:hypothetical protein